MLKRRRKFYISSSLGAFLAGALLTGLLACAAWFAFQLNHRGDDIAQSPVSAPASPENTNPEPEPAPEITATQPVGDVAPVEPATQPPPVPAIAPPPEPIPQPVEPVPLPAAPAATDVQVKPQEPDTKPAAPPAPVEPIVKPEWYDAGQHLVLGLSGPLTEDSTRLLTEVRPFGVLLMDSDLSSMTDIAQRTENIRKTAPDGEPAPLIMVVQEGGSFNPLGLDDAISPGLLGENADVATVRALGRDTGLAAARRGISVVLAPVLGVFEPKAARPSWAARSFGKDENTVTVLGLAYAAGLMDAGVIPVAKYYPGLASATSDTLLPHLRQDMQDLPKVLYPFHEAAMRNAPGILAGHVVVDLFDDGIVPRPASLSPVLIRKLLRERWEYDGVVLADDITDKSLCRDRTPQDAAVEALLAGCDAMLLLDAHIEQVRSICRAIHVAVQTGLLEDAQLSDSARRLEAWREWLAHPTPPNGLVPEVSDPALVAQQPPQTPALIPEPEPEPENFIRFVEHEDDLLPEEPVPNDVVTSTTSADEAVVLPEPEATMPPEVETPSALPKPTIKVSVSVAPSEPAKSMSDTVDQQKSADEAQTAAPGPRWEEITHTIESGETLSHIAARYSVPLQTLRTLNHLKSDAIKYGTKLKVLRQVTPESPVKGGPPQPPNTVRRHYRVRRGDTLSEIAQHFNVSGADIREWNCLDSDIVKVDQVLYLYLPFDAEKEFVDERYTEYTVQSGDSLGRLAQKYNLSLSELLELNDMSVDDTLRIGQTIKVPKTPSLGE